MGSVYWPVPQVSQRNSERTALTLPAAGAAVLTGSDGAAVVGTVVVGAVAVVAAGGGGVAAGVATAGGGVGFAAIGGGAGALGVEVVAPPVPLDTAAGAVEQAGSSLIPIAARNSARAALTVQPPPTGLGATAVPAPVDPAGVLGEGGVAADTLEVTGDAVAVGVGAGAVTAALVVSPTPLSAAAVAA